MSDLNFGDKSIVEYLTADEREILEETTAISEMVTDMTGEQIKLVGNLKKETEGLRVKKDELQEALKVFFVKE